MHAIALSYFLSLILCVCSIDNITRFRNDDSILSRQKRYLIFPEGSSFQVIVEIVVPLIGDFSIFRTGATAALAWELPSDPSVFLNKKKFGKVGLEPEPVAEEPMTPQPEYDYHGHAHDKSDWFENKMKPIYYTKPVYISKTIPIQYKAKPKYSPYHNGFSYRPTYSTFKTHFSPWRKYSTVKLSPSYQYSSKRKSQWNDVHRQYRVKQNSDRWYKNKKYSRMHPVYSEYHRKSRRDLFAKIEKLFLAGQLDGKSCLLKAICEISDATNGIGSFMEEILKVLFDVKPYQHEPATKDIYDQAVDNNENCADKFPLCRFSIFSLFGEMQKINRNLNVSLKEDINQNKTTY